MFQGTTGACPSSGCMPWVALPPDISRCEVWQWTTRTTGHCVLASLWPNCRMRQQALRQPWASAKKGPQHATFWVMSAAEWIDLQKNGGKTIIENLQEANFKPSHTFLSLANGFETCWPNARGNQILAKVHHFVLPCPSLLCFCPCLNDPRIHWLVTD